MLIHWVSLPTRQILTPSNGDLTYNQVGNQNQKSTFLIQNGESFAITICEVMEETLWNQHYKWNNHGRRGCLLTLLSKMKLPLSMYNWASCGSLLWSQKVFGWQVQAAKKGIVWNRPLGAQCVASNPLLFHVEKTQISGSSDPPGCLPADVLRGKSNWDGTLNTLEGLCIPTGQG